jgi:hypothetical protein
MAQPTTSIPGAQQRASELELILGFRRLEQPVQP